MIETHPFGIFVPPKAKHLLLGSFTTKEANFDPAYDWFYGTTRNQFWKILRLVYKLPLENKHHKQELFTKLNLALGDIIWKCTRQKNSNLDINLSDIVYNWPAIRQVLSQNKITTIYFSSRYVEKKFKQRFKELDINLITLPSPSPRFAKMSFKEKVEAYRSLLPKLAI